MKRVFAYFILIIYLNMALVPHLSEVDIYVPGTVLQVDEINSFVEQMMVAFGLDTTADDEDGDSGTEDDGTVVNPLSLCFSHIVHNALDFSFLYSYEEQNAVCCSTGKFNLPSIYYGIDSPPPEV
jgi:hypothetical protein